MMTTRGGSGHGTRGGTGHARGGRRGRGGAARGHAEGSSGSRGQRMATGTGRRGNKPYFEPPVIPFMADWVREDHGGEMPQGFTPVELPPNQSGWRVRIRPTQWTITNNGQNLPPIFVNVCINNQLNTITLRGVDENYNGIGVERTCGLYVSGSNYRITNGWRDFCQAMGIEAGFGLVLGVIDGARNIVSVEIEDKNEENEDDNDEEDDE
ncbi:hypothetical protein RIF29_30851 [Crotalaria pallida]|uniref:TF-B3 domain-containing protein n=1 Tax=Crotalaria pallida TaxID=3830 RepID=A0AAN9EHD2_CROPI